MLAFKLAGLVYFVVLFALIMWKGNAFLRLPIVSRAALGLGAWLVFVAWAIICKLYG